MHLGQGTREDEYLSTLVERTGAPAFVADVPDSSISLVSGLDTNGHHWQARLNLDNAAALLIEKPEDMDGETLWMATPEFEAAIKHRQAELDAEMPADTEGTPAWASAAGVQALAQRTRIEEVLRAQATFVKELFDALLDEPGFPEAAHFAP